MSGVVKDGLGVLAPMQEVVSDHDREVGGDPVGDEEQEVLVLTAGCNVGLQQEPNPEPYSAEDKGRERPPLLDGKLDPQCEEGHRPGVNV